jgi:hypothetical protein
MAESEWHKKMMGMIIIWYITTAPMVALKKSCAVRSDVRPYNSTVKDVDNTQWVIIK